MDLGRRLFLKRKITLLSAAGSPFLKFHELLAKAVVKGPFDLFTKDQILTLQDYFDTLLPKTSKGPSATESGALNFITKLILDELPAWRRVKYVRIQNTQTILKAYLQLCERLNRLSEKSMQKTFVACSSEERVQLVETLARDSQGQVGYRVKTLLGEQMSDSDLFTVSREHVFQAYFSDPRYGANQNFEAWDSIGYICHFNYLKSNPKCSESHHSQ